MESRPWLPWILTFILSSMVNVYQAMTETVDIWISRKQSQLNVTHNTIIQDPQNTVPDRPKKSLEHQLISTVLNGIQTMADKWEI